MEAREARRAADAYVARIEAAGEGRPPPFPVVLHPAFVLQLLQRMREYGPRLSAVRAAVGKHLATEQMTPEDAIRSEHQRQAAAQVSIANAITSLRMCATLDWSEYVESVSLVERGLDRDPAGVYRSMDFLSRDRYRQATEQLAERTGEAQLRVGLRAIESARLSAEGGATATDLAYRPGLRGRVRRFVFAHATAAYLGSVGVVTMILSGLGLAYASELGGSPWLQAGAALALLIPPPEGALALIH